MSLRVLRIGDFAGSELLVAVGIASVVLGVGTWVTPKAIEAMSPAPAELGAVEVEGETPAERAAVVEGLRALLSRCYAYVWSREADGTGPASITLWQSDGHHRGSLDADEVLVLTHSGLLETITATIVEGVEGREIRVEAEDLRAADAAARLREYGTARASVIATGVRALSVSPVRDGAGTVELELGLTWSPVGTDSEDEAGSSRTTLRVRLRLVEGMGR